MNTGNRMTFATLSCSNLKSMFQFIYQFIINKKKFTTPPVIATDCFEMYFQNKLRFVRQVSRETLSWSVNALCEGDILDQLITVDADEDH